jgi:hypothetical protein
MIEAVGASCASDSETGPSYRRRRMIVPAEELNE